MRQFQYAILMFGNIGVWCGSVGLGAVLRVGVFLGFEVW